MLHATVSALRALVRRGSDQPRRQPVIVSIHGTHRAVTRRAWAALASVVVPARYLTTHGFGAVARRFFGPTLSANAILVAASPSRLAVDSGIARAIAPRSTVASRIGAWRAPEQPSSQTARAERRGGDAHPRSVLDALRPGRGRAARRARVSVDGVARAVLARFVLEARRERALAAGVAMLVVVASVVSVTPAAGRGGTGSVNGAGDGLRIALNDVASSSFGIGEFTDGAGPGDPGDVVDATAGEGAARALDAEPDAAPLPEGPYALDGTLLKPVAVDTSVPDASDQLRSYRVKTGDTLIGIAAKFDVSMMTVWWANDLKAKDDLHVGQTLVIPPVNGVVVTVKDGDTLDAIASSTGVEKAAIMAFNGLADDQLVIGQVLIIPGALGDAIATPKPTVHPASKPASTSHSTSHSTSKVTAPATTAAAGSRGRSPGGLHQPVLPQRPLRDRYRAADGTRSSRRGGHRDLRRLEEQRRRVPGLDLARITTCTRPTTTCRPSRWDAASVSRAASIGRIGAPGMRPGRTATSRCGSATVWAGGSAG